MNVAKNTKSVFFLATAGSLAVFQRLLRDEDGQDLIEYALVFTFVGLGAIAAMKSVSASVATVFASIGTTLTNAT